MDSIRNNTHIINAVTPSINNTIITNISKINVETIINEFNQTSLLNTNNATNNNTMLNDSIYKKIENSIINPPIREHIINTTINHLESTSLANNSNYSLINEKNVNNLTSFHETDILENKFDSNSNKANSVNSTDKLINSTIIEKPVTNNKNEQTIVINQNNNNNNDLLSLIINIIFPLCCLFIIIYIIYYCIKRRKKSNTLDHSDLNKVRLKTSSKLSYKKIQNTSSLNIIDPNNMSMSEIKVQNINNENLMSRISAISSSSTKKKKENKNNNAITGEEGHKNA